MAGLSYHLNDQTNAYINLGNFSRAPLSFNVFDWSNNLYDNVKNAKNLRPMRLPDFYNLDLYTGLEFSIVSSFIKTIKVSSDFFNIFNLENINDATDGISHDSDLANVWYARESWWSTSLAITL